VDYREKAGLMPAPCPITDIHLHVNGPRAALVYEEVSRLFGIDRLLSQTRIADADAVKAVMGSRITFVSVPDWSNPDKGKAFRDGFLDSIAQWHARGSRIVKFWAAPRLYELIGGDASDVVPLDSPWRIRHAELAQSLGMMFMAHIADPDTWFKTRYADATVYRLKRDHYLSLERMLDRFPSPWLGAHMGGSPEDLSRLDGLLERHPNLLLDTSATKWVVRELSKHPVPRTREFFQRWDGRLLFGSDIVTLDDHLQPRTTPTPASPMSDLAASPAQAFDLYASRYLALRTMFETDYRGPSPIADPDLHMVDPKAHSPLDAPMLQGLSLPEAILRNLYRDTADRTVFNWIAAHA
jgi:hypothetical protein